MPMPQLELIITTCDWSTFSKLFQLQQTRQVLVR